MPATPLQCMVMALVVFLGISDSDSLPSIPDDPEWVSQDSLQGQIAASVLLATSARGSCNLQNLKLPRPRWSSLKYSASSCLKFRSNLKFIVAVIWWWNQPLLTTLFFSLSRFWDALCHVMPWLFGNPTIHLQFFCYVRSPCCSQLRQGNSLTILCFCCRLVRVHAHTALNFVRISRDIRKKNTWADKENSGVSALSMTIWGLGSAENSFDGC